MKKRALTPRDLLKQFQPHGWWVMGRLYTQDPEIVMMAEKVGESVVQLYEKVEPIVTV